MVFAVIIGLLLIPYQTFLVVKWQQLKRESSTLVEYIYEHQKNNGDFPKNISDYEFKNLKLSSNFRYRISSRGFELHYFVGTKGTTHFYYHTVGKWAYYPD